MTIDITNPELIARQLRMTNEKCGFSVDMIRKIMAAPDEKIISSIRDARAAAATMTGENLTRAQGFLRGFEIEAEIRGITA